MPGTSVWHVPVPEPPIKALWAMNGIGGWLQTNVAVADASDIQSILGQAGETREATAAVAPVAITSQWTSPFGTTGGVTLQTNNTNPGGTAVPNSKIMAFRYLPLVYPWHGFLMVHIVFAWSNTAPAAAANNEAVFFILKNVNLGTARFSGVRVRALAVANQYAVDVLTGMTEGAAGAADVAAWTTVAGWLTTDISPGSDSLANELHSLAWTTSPDANRVPRAVEFDGHYIEPATGNFATFGARIRNARQHYALFVGYENVPFPAAAGTNSRAIDLHHIGLYQTQHTRTELAVFDRLGDVLKAIALTRPARRPPRR